MSVAPKPAVPLLHGTAFGSKGTRFVTPCRAGFACYQGSRNSRGEWKGVLAGVTTSELKAHAFLDGGAIRLSRR